MHAPLLQGFRVLSSAGWGIVEDLRIPDLAHYLQASAPRGFSKRK